MDDLYKEFPNESVIDIKRRKDLKEIYFNFLADFKKYLVEYVRESAVDLAISQIEVTSSPQKLFDNCEGIHVTLKNQGGLPCFLTTDRQGGYRLDPNESQKFWMNAQTLILTLSGTTTVGYIRS